jgi:hypothetical protein
MARFFGYVLQAIKNKVRDMVYGKSIAAIRARLNGSIVKRIVKSKAFFSEHFIYLFIRTRKFKDEK